MGSTTTYDYKESLYINTTNRCSNQCIFCIRTKSKGVTDDLDLWLDHEPTVEEILADIKKWDLSKFSEIVFCGYGEPTYRIFDIIEISKELKTRYRLPIRINTNGQANLIHNQNVLPLLSGIIDSVSISLNASDSELYHQLCKSVYGKKAFDAVIKFAIDCKGIIPDISFSVVDNLPSEEIEKCRELANQIDVNFKVRHFT